MVTISKKKFKQKFEVKMYSLYAQSIKEVLITIVKCIMSLLKDEIAKMGCYKVDKKKKFFFV
ncbi:MAG: hypothetical protein ACLTRP_06100 [Clostridioides difficile]